MVVGQNYKIISELGSGGMGVVFQAVDLTLEREIALKKLRPEFSRSSEVADRFRKEAKIQARMNHHGIAQLYTMFKDGESFYMAMEFVSGTPLTNLVPQPWPNSVAILCQILESLEYAHSLGVLHRDIKPENIVVSAKGVVKIMDFGIAHVLGATRQTRDRTIVGTPEYMAPERITGKDADKRSDIYSLGILLFELIAGRIPFDASAEYELLRQQIETPMPRLRQFRQDAPEFLEEVTLKACEKQPDKRYSSCKEMADKLRTATMAAVGTKWDDLPKQVGLAAVAAGGVERWRQRIEALASNGEIEVAKRVLDSALADFPANPVLSGCTEFVERQQNSQSGVSSVESGRNRYVREVMTRMMEHERTGAWKTGADLARSALEKYPKVRVFALALKRFEQEIAR